MAAFAVSVEAGTAPPATHAPVAMPTAWTGAAAATVSLEAATFFYRRFRNLFFFSFASFSAGENAAENTPAYSACRAGRWKQACAGARWGWNAGRQRGCGRAGKPDFPPFPGLSFLVFRVLVIPYLSGLYQSLQAVPLLIRLSGVFGGVGRFGGLCGGFSPGAGRICRVSGGFAGVRRLCGLCAGGVCSGGLPVSTGSAGFDGPPGVSGLRALPVSGIAGFRRLCGILAGLAGSAGCVPEVFRQVVSN